MTLCCERFSRPVEVTGTEKTTRRAVNLGTILKPLDQFPCESYGATTSNSLLIFGSIDLSRYRNILFVRSIIFFRSHPDLSIRLDVALNIRWQLFSPSPAQHSLLANPSYEPTGATTREPRPNLIYTDCIRLFIYDPFRPCEVNAASSILLMNS